MSINFKVFASIYTYILHQIGHCFSRCFRTAESHGYACDQLKLALAVSRVWAYVGLYMSKTFEKIFQLILSTPEDLLTIPANCTSRPLTTNGKKIQIINAFSEHGQITNKFKIFLSSFYENNTPDSIHNTNGFNFHSYVKLLDTSILWCNYILQNQNEINPKTFFKDVQQMMITKHGDKVYRTFDENLDTSQNPLFMGHVSFDDNKNYIHDTATKIESTNSDNNDLSTLIAELELSE